MAEPLAVCIHAAKQAGNLVGKRVLITGCAPIGLLCSLVAQRCGAKEIITTDIHDYPLSMAKQLGAETTLNVSKAEDVKSFSIGSGNTCHATPGRHCAARLGWRYESTRTANDR